MPNNQLEHPERTVSSKNKKKAGAPGVSRLVGWWEVGQGGLDPAGRETQGIGQGDAPRVSNCICRDVKAGQAGVGGERGAAVARARLHEATAALELRLRVTSRGRRAQRVVAKASAQNASHEQLAPDPGW